MIKKKLGLQSSLFLYLLIFPFSINTAELVTSVRDLSPIQIVYPNALGSQLGASVSSLGDFDGDGLLDFAIGAPGFEGVHIGRLQDKGAVFIVYGKSLQTAKAVDLSQEQTNLTIITGNAQLPVGSAIAGLDDLNADGFSDIALGTENSVAGYVFYGHSNPSNRIHLDDISVSGMTMQNTGQSVSTVGDINGDGFKDALFGSPVFEHITKDNQNLQFGAFTLLFGSNSLIPDLNAQIPDPSKYYTNRGTPDTNYGVSVSGGFDLNVDGFSDIIITADNSKRNQMGEAYIIYGGHEVFANSKVEYGLTLQSISGYVAAAKDIDANGFPEIIAGLPNNQALILKGRNQLQGKIDLSKNPQNWGTLITGAEHVYSVGDLNGDGFGDLAAALPNAKSGSLMMAGQVLFLFGRPELPEVIDISKIQQGQPVAIDYVLVHGMEAFDTFGFSIAGIGDIQNDGFNEVVIGAPTQQLPGDSLQKRPGSVYLIQGIELYYAMQTHRSTFSQRGQKQ